MKISTARRYKKNHKLIGGFLMSNPVKTLGLELPFIIVMATSLKNAVALSIQVSLIHIITMMIAVVFFRVIPKWLQTVACVGISTIVTIISKNIVSSIFTDISNLAGMYLYLVAVNSLTLSKATKLKNSDRLIPVTSTAIKNVIVFSVTMMFVSAFREAFGNGTLWGAEIPVSVDIYGLLIPFSGFIIVGFLLAGVKTLNKAILGMNLAKAMRQEQIYTPIGSDTE